MLTLPDIRPEREQTGRKFWGFRSTVPERKILFPPMVCKEA